MTNADKCKLSWVCVWKAAVFFFLILFFTPFLLNFNHTTHQELSSSLWSRQFESASACEDFMERNDHINSWIIFERNKHLSALSYCYCKFSVNLGWHNLNLMYNTSKKLLLKLNKIIFIMCLARWLYLINILYILSIISFFMVIQNYFCMFKKKKSIQFNSISICWLTSLSKALKQKSKSQTSVGLEVTTEIIRRKWKQMQLCTNQLQNYV